MKRIIMEIILLLLVGYFVAIDLTDGTVNMSSHFWSIYIVAPILLIFVISDICNLMNKK